MSVRVSTEEVKEIINTSITDCTPFIIAANTLINKFLSGCEDLSADQLKEIERWLAAHFVAIRDPQASSESTGSASASYQVAKAGDGLDSTSWGQMAKILDTSGILSASVGLKRASVKAIDLEL